MSLQTWELLSYIVTVIGLPLAILTFVFEQRKERENEDEEVYQQLADNYMDFLKLVMFEILISLFERAYLLAYEDDMSGKQLRRWMSWEDYMREWCSREDFRQMLPRLLQGEDPDFCTHITRIAQQIATIS